MLHITVAVAIAQHAHTALIETLVTHGCMRRQHQIPQGVKVKLKSQQQQSSLGTLESHLQLVINIAFTTNLQKDYIIQT